MRSFISFGLPIEADGIRYSDLLDRKNDQRDYIGAFQQKIYDYFND